MTFLNELLLFPPADLSTLANVVTTLAKMDKKEGSLGDGEADTETNGNGDVASPVKDSAAKAFGTMAKMVQPDISFKQVGCSDLHKLEH